MFYCKGCLKEYDNKWTIDGKDYYIYNRTNNKGGEGKRAYCYNCRPLGSKERTNIALKHRIEKTCSVCREIKSLSEFRTYKKKSRVDGYLIQYTPDCLICIKQRQILHKRKIKNKCVEYKGGKCIKCGYNRCVGALQFHHRNPKDKTFEIAAKGSVDWEKMQAELDKCDLLCANCHHEIEYGFQPPEPKISD